MTVGERITAFMECNDITPDELAEEIGISLKRMQTMLNDSHRMKADDYMKICSVLGCEPGYFAKPTMPNFAMRSCSAKA